MSGSELTVGKALATFWDAFILSPLGTPQNLARVGLRTYLGGSNFQGWDGTGDFYGRTEVHLLREDGTCFIWTVAVLFEQGEHEGMYWQQGGAYADMGVIPTSDDFNVGLYHVDDAELPSIPFEVADLASLAECLLPLSRKCFQDLESIYQNNHFDTLLELAQQRLAGQDYWEVNPLRSI